MAQNNGNSNTSNKERLREITEGIERGIKELFASGRYADYLRTMSRFHRYSVNNVMLIHMQMPSATHVAGFNKWRDQFGRHVKKGAKSIKIIAPTPFKKTVEEMKLDPDTKAPMLDKDGKAIMVQREIQIPMFKVVSVFDVSQTYGRPLPQLASTLRGNVQHYEIFMEALRRSSPVPIRMETMASNTDGYFNSKDQNIAIRQGMSEVQTVCATIHEIAHSKLHNPELEPPKPEWKVVMVSDGGTKRDYMGGFETEAEAEAAAESSGWRFVDENRFEWRLEVEPDNAAEKTAERNRRTEEVEAESISYAVCQYYGIETGDNSFGYIASWSKDKELPELKASLETINKTACGLINDIDRHFQEICKERGIDLTAEQQTQAPVQEQEVSTPEQTEAPTQKPENPVSEQTEAPAPEQETVTPEMASEQTAPSAPETTLDEYPMPDPIMDETDLKYNGYMDNDMLPLSKERGMELFNKDFTVYAIVDGGSLEMLLDQSDFESYPLECVFVVGREEWEDSKEFQTLVQDRMNHQEEREAAFLAHTGDCFAIYQVKYDEAQRDIRFESLDRLKALGRTVERENYELAYTAPLPAVESTDAALNQLYSQFNNDQPADYLRPSMSVSDIIAVKRGGEVSCHYCDRIGFTELTGFLSENPLKNAEMAVEDDYNMIDGIINNGPKQPTVTELEQQASSGSPISLMELAGAVHREQREQKKSVLEQLKQQPKQPPKKTAQKKSAEREI